MESNRVRSIPADLTPTIRQQVLRSHQPAEFSEYPLDQHPDTFHVGAFDAGRLVAVASVFREHHPELPADPTAWRIRGMATLPEQRGIGHGREMLRALVEHVRLRRGRSIWCNARSDVVCFYRRAGFETVGKEFELAGLGPHFLMQLELP